MSVTKEQERGAGGQSAEGHVPGGLEVKTELPPQGAQVQSLDGEVNPAYD